MDAVFRKDALVRAIEAIAAAGGSEPREARLVAENLVEANLLGHDSHGIGMMPRYVESLLSGGLKPNRRVEVRVWRLSVRHKFSMALRMLIALVVQAQQQPVGQGGDEQRP